MLVTGPVRMCLKDIKLAGYRPTGHRPGGLEILRNGSGECISFMCDNNECSRESCRLQRISCVRAISEQDISASTSGLRFAAPLSRCHVLVHTRRAVGVYHCRYR